MALRAWLIKLLSRALMVWSVEVTGVEATRDVAIDGACVPFGSAPACPAPCSAESGALSLAVGAAMGFPARPSLGASGSAPGACSVGSVQRSPTADRSHGSKLDGEVSAATMALVITKVPP